jgi:hypothetical protein
VACAATVAVDGLLRDPFALLRAMPRDGWTDGLQRAFWLPWQIGDNLRHDRGAWDASVFVGPRDASLLDLAGNPGAATLGAPLQMVLVPAAAHAAWLLLLVVSGAVAGAALGGAVSAGRGGVALLGAALVAGCATWTTDLADGAMAAGWVAPALAVAWAGAAERPRAMALAGAVGAIASPVPTIAGALAARAVPGWRPSRRSRVLDAVAAGIVLASCAVRVAWPPLGASVEAVGSASRALLPLHVVDGALPLPAWTLPGLLGLATCAGRGRSAAGLSAALLALTSLAPPGAWHREALAAVLVVAGVGVVRCMSATPAVAWLAALAVLAEPSVLRARGAPARPWTGPPWEVPAALVEMGRSPRSHVILHAPVHRTREGGVGLLPFHQQRVVGGPGLHDDGAARRAMLAWMEDEEALRTVAVAGDAPLTRATPSPAFQLARLGVDRVVVLGGDPVLRTGLTRVLGPSPSGVWALAAPGGGQHRAPPAPDAGTAQPSTAGKR